MTAPTNMPSTTPHTSPGTTAPATTLAIIGGSGLARIEDLQVERREVQRTPYGDPSGPVTFGRLRGCPVAFLPRHGYGHTIPPHDINYRANLWALKDIGIERVVSIASVGGICADLHPGTLVLPDQILDYTWGRESTYFDTSELPVTHIDFTQPYDADLRARVLAAATSARQPILDGGVYACTQGPRLESAAEINRIERDGGDMVGMTGMPEAALARELGLPYATLAVVVNHAAGRGASRYAISTADMANTLETSMARVRAILGELIAHVEE